MESAKNILAYEINDFTWFYFTVDSIIFIIYFNCNHIAIFYKVIHPIIPTDSKAVNFFNYPYLIALNIIWMIVILSFEYYQRSYFKKHKET